MMKRMTIFARGVAISALMALPLSPAIAGKHDRAKEAIAHAQGKIDAANKLGANGDVPRIQAEAEATLRTAREDLASGHKEAAIADANRAAELADTAINLAAKNRAEAEQAQRVNAEQTAAAAQEQAAAATARANAAEQTAAAAQADAQAARNAPPVVIAAPAPTTTVTTETTKTATAAPVRSSTRTVVRKPVKRSTTTAARGTTEKTTTTVTTQPN